MPVLTASPTLGDLLKFELNASYTRETVTLKAGTSYRLGSVLGRITASGEYRLSPAAEVVGDQGAETAIAVLLEAVDATDGVATGLIAARGPVILADGALIFEASVDQPAERAAKIVQLATVGLVARATV
ncbi:conserved protein of unknown function [Magnetospirillum gryphiswaldense MSR-1 v2]|uniref:Head decoration protein n=1 Tax=Magnetospirillum gryphiswaldense (strain DSM 6361 / JCM 21280 / NBRC 15271 / MSR-1) TaxID=431944 RepID=V6F2X9_MAGGM|nr:head decoration protein [Magnetospirillum gryphiswaldense]CDK99757.1 conserved protein of unknown function [Magnetospirillum gryphiswaldense MSR-1 v2]